MKQEQIEKAANNFLLNEPLDLPKTGIGAFKDGFIFGAQWRINSVWHKKCDIPQPFLPCLVELMEGRNGEKNRYVVARRSEYEWIELTHYEHSQVHRWAYVSDLLPGTGKEE